MWGLPDPASVRSVADGGNPDFGNFASLGGNQSRGRIFGKWPPSYLIQSIKIAVLGIAKCTHRLAWLAPGCIRVEHFLKGLI